MRRIKNGKGAFRNEMKVLPGPGRELDQFEESHPETVLFIILPPSPRKLPLPPHCLLYSQL